MALRFVQGLGWQSATEGSGHIENDKGGEGRREGGGAGSQGVGKRDLAIGRAGEREGKKRQGGVGSGAVRWK